MKFLIIPNANDEIKFLYRGKIDVFYIINGTQMIQMGWMNTDFLIKNKKIFGLKKETCIFAAR